MNVLLCVLLILALLIVVDYKHERFLISPTALFLIGFILAALCALFFSGRWGLSLNVVTAFVLVGGALCFCLTSVSMDFVIDRRLSALKADSRGRQISPFPYPHKAGFYCAVFVAAIFQIVILFLAIFEIGKLVPAESIVTSIGSFKEINTFSLDKVQFAFPLKQLINFSKAGGYLFSVGFSYLLCHKTSFSNNAFRPLLLIITFVGLVASAGLGFVINGRTLGLGYIAIACFSFFIFSKRLGDKLFTKKRLLICLAIVALGLASFQFLSFGRSDGISFLDYIAIYLGAPIANLDSFIISGKYPTSDLFGQMTFSSIITYIGAKCHVSDFSYVLDLPFLMRGDYSMGNVYTIYYSFIKDFGLTFVPLLIAFMAAFAQFFYRLCFSTRLSDTKLILVVLLYSFVAYQLLFSFFSCKFYEEVISPGLVTTAIYIVIFGLIFFKFAPWLFDRIKRLFLRL